MTEADAKRMSPHQVQQLIWKPGLSTAEKVSDISGRGMGMDIVKTKIEELSGTVEVQSDARKGTTIRITLPLTLAILPSLMVEIAGDVFALPMESVIEIVRVAQDQVHTVHGRRDGHGSRACHLAGPARRRAGLSPRRQANNGDSDGRTAGPTPETTTVVVRRHGIGNRPGRRLRDRRGRHRHQVASPRTIAIFAGIAGASILGDGRVRADPRRVGPDRVRSPRRTVNCNPQRK